MKSQLKSKQPHDRAHTGNGMNRRQFVQKNLAKAGALAFSTTLLSQSWGADLAKGKTRRVLIDTDANNEMDDQYAIVRALIAPELKVEAITSAGYHDRKKGAQRSLDELNRVVELMGLTGEVPTALGSNGPMKNKMTPLPSAASQMIIDHAMRDDPEPLYVLGLGQFTNLASALLIEPRIKDRVIFACIDGDYKHGKKPAWGKGTYNWTNDVPAVQAIFESDVRYIHMPARSVSEEMYIGRSVIRKRLDGLGPVYEYLGSLWESERFKDHQGKILWDLALIHAMIDPDHGKRVSVPAPMVKDDGNTQDFPANPRKVEVYASIDANEVYSSFWAAAKTFQDKKN